MLLKEILQKIEYQLISGSIELEISKLTWDSRTVVNDCAFICVRGKKIDRHEYALLAAQSGATCIVLEHEIEGLPEAVTVIKVSCTRHAMAAMANNFYAFPSEKVCVTGLIGDAGKSSCAWTLASLLAMSGVHCAVIDNMTIDNPHESIAFVQMAPNVPDSIALVKAIAELADRGVRHILLVISRTAILEYKYSGLRLDYLIVNEMHTVADEWFMNQIQGDRTELNYHPAAEFFRACKRIILHEDNRFAELLQGGLHVIETHGQSGIQELKISDLKLLSTHTECSISYKDQTRAAVRLPIPGRFFFENFLVVAYIALEVSLDMESVCSCLERISCISGRFEIVGIVRGASIIVDAAYSASSLERLLACIAEICHGRMITVFGSGGDRGQQRRIELGRSAGQGSSHCIITTDNPRTEHPEDIIGDIELGLKQTACSYDTIVDRQEAIHKALAMVCSGDFVVVSGKGNENYQIFRDAIKHFDDREVIIEFLKQEQVVRANQSV